MDILGGGGGIQRKGPEDPPNLGLRKITCTHAEEDFHKDRQSQLDDPQEADAPVTLYLSVHETGQVPKKEHPVLGVVARRVAY